MSEKSAKDVIFTEANIRNWIGHVYFTDIDFLHLSELIPSEYACSPERFPKRQDIRKRLEGQFLRDSVSDDDRLIRCCFVEAFKICQEARDDWTSPKNIVEACEKFECLFNSYKYDNPVSIYRPTLEYFKRSCESLYNGCYLERHPDDKENSSETRYRIRCDFSLYVSKK